MSKVSELEKLNRLKQEAAISEEEYERLKKEIMDDSDDLTEKISQFASRIKENEWLFALHLSQLAGVLVPYAGFVIPIVLWQTKKDLSPQVDRHGRMVANWIISSLIYSAIAFGSTLLLVGIPLYFGIMMLNLAFPVIGALEAKKGNLWKYPLAIPFFKID